MQDLNNKLMGQSPLKILVVANSLRGGGAERVVADLSEQWISRGDSVVVITQSDGSDDVYSLNKKVTRVALGLEKKQGILVNVNRILAIRREIKRHRPDIVLGMMTTSSILSILAARGLPCKVIATEHTHPPAQGLSKFWEKLRRYTYPKATQVVALTRDTAKWIEKHVPGSKTAIIPNAVNWPLQEDATDTALTPQQANKQGNLLLAVGRLHKDKGFDLLIHAFASIHQHYPQWQLKILGEGPERESLQTLIDDHQAQAYMTMPGRTKRLSLWYEAADIYVLSSRVEGLSNSLLEAMAYGLPCVSFDCETGPREIIRPDVDGLLVAEVENVQALAANLSLLMGNPTLRKDLSRRAIDVRDRFSMHRVNGMWHALFSEILKS